MQEVLVQPGGGGRDQSSEDSQGSVDNAEPGTSTGLAGQGPAGCKDYSTAGRALVSQPGLSAVVSGQTLSQDSEIVQQFDPLVGDDVSSEESDEVFADTEEGDERAAAIDASNEDRLLRMREYVDRFVLDQSHWPRRGDIVSYFDTDYEDWIVAKIIAVNKKSSIYNR